MTPSTLEREVESALSAAAARERVRQVVLAALDDGLTRDQVYELLDRTRLRLRETGDEWQEQVVMDVMDLFHGAAHPSLRL